MSAQEHTPGPWFVKYVIDGNHIHSEHRTIAHMVKDYNTLAPIAEQNANATFIVKACNEHDDLRRLLDQFVNHPPVNLSADWFLLCDEARKLLTK